MGMGFENIAAGSSLLNGSGAPSSGTGDDGDFYINTAAATLYGPKTAGAWGSPTSLVGPAGASGVMFSNVRVVTANATLAGGEVCVVNHAGGAGKTMTLPTAASVPRGTPICVIAWNPGYGSSTTINRGGSDNIGATGTTTSMSIGDAVADMSCILVSDGVSRWIRIDQSPSAFNAPGIANGGFAYISAGGGIIMTAFGDSVTINTPGGSLTVNVDGSVTVTGPLTFVPSAAPAAPDAGWTLFCDQGDGDKMKLRPASGADVPLT